MKKLFLNWDVIENLVIDLSNKIDTSKYKGIFGVPRGGLIPAVLLSHRTEIKMVDYIDDTVLVVDDIVDTGETLKDITNDIVCLHKKFHSKKEPMLYGNLVDNDIWIVYPWELEDSKEKRDKTFGN
jgi:hypoxanthine phosphoribosyltransferase